MLENFMEKMNDQIAKKQQLDIYMDIIREIERQRLSTVGEIVNLITRDNQATKPSKGIS